MKIALAQIRSFPGQLRPNVQKHYQFVKKAAALDAQVVVFPELSVSNYEPKLAADLATSIHDPLFAPLKELSKRAEITIWFGVPIRVSDGVHIGLIIFYPEATPQMYCKRYLHEDELPYFIPGQGMVILQKENQRIAPAICYESLLPEHAAQVVEAGATLYLASVAKPAKGIAKAYAHYAAIAAKYQIPVLMVNGIGPMDDFVGAGQSAAWNQAGELVDQLSGAEEGLLVIDLGLMSTSTHRIKT